MNIVLIKKHRKKALHSRQQLELRKITSSKRWENKITKYENIQEELNEKENTKQYFQILN